MTFTFSRQARAVPGSAIRDLLTLTSKPHVISLAGGLPAPELLPRDRVAQAAAAALADPAALQYTETAGLPRLRELVAGREGVPPDQVVVTTGSQQALDLLARVLLDPGDAVVVERPTYTGALQVLQAAGAVVSRVPLDRDGMDTGALAEMLRAGLRPTLVHTVSAFHNPRGVTLAPHRRAELAALADRYGFLVVEDNPYGELYFHAPPPPPVPGDRVLRLGSVSKTLAPALRTGWLAGPRPVCTAVERLKQAADLCGSALNHAVAADLLADGQWLAGHLASLRREYGARAAALDAALAAQFGDVLEHAPADGGMFTWVRFTDGTDTARLLGRAVGQGVAFVPGAAFAGGADEARLCFTHRDAATLAEAAARLRRAHAQV